MAAAGAKEVAFVVSVSGPGVIYVEQEKYANAERLRAWFQRRGDTGGPGRTHASGRLGAGKVGMGEMQRELDEAWRKR